MSRQLFELILAIKRRCQCNEEQIRTQLGLTAAQFYGLIVLEEGSSIPGGEFARRMGLSPSRGSRVLNSLVRSGFVVTRDCPCDRRTMEVSLTSKGKRMKNCIADRMKACESRVRDRLDDSGVRRIRESLELLETAL
ncbi:MAG TPA: MarR family transcriptional regulator [Sedimentisphaerales bacterium]|nr:MarR family transcriptional regulator [Sedimentisphaerales bacterium]HRS11359.1 MarR family transcriptional regulator [Sedimentisphaerales bacterium]HRV47931.1 MarR family transcriptional regulator [Sedimentisphaerales bacterium]